MDTANHEKPLKTTFRSADNEIQKLLQDYIQAEREFEEEMQDRAKEYCENQRRITSKDPSVSLAEFCVQLEESHHRNQKFLEDLVLAKARLRTFSAYSPTDEELRQCALIYRNRLRKNRKQFKS